MNQAFSNHHHVKKVLTFSELADTNFEGDHNAICWERNLNGDFAEIVAKLSLHEDITEISIEDLLNLELSPAGDIARQIILNDLKLLSDLGASPSLNLLKKYVRDTDFDFISTDVYSYHVDRSPVPTSTFLCTYFGASGDILPNAQAKQKILIPAIREKLKELNGGEDGFESFLEENYFDLHYQPLEGAQPINLGIGNLWRLAVDHPGQQVSPCVHRAPKENEGEYRLLLIC
ncbi:MAG: DUF1826 domain-containing protein [Flavobacteriales bacterium]|nr:MAG: DUF1826 domain-containing protein [Flavobacteriales bacterium]